MTEKKIDQDDAGVRKCCAKCATLMVLERVLPRFGPLPEIRLYRCLRCGSMVDETVYC
jgi:hypothetical protein